MGKCTRSAAIGSLAVLLGISAAAAAPPTVPLPPQRPADLPPPPVAAAPPASKPTVPIPAEIAVPSLAEAADCDRVFASDVVRAERLPAITGDAGCGVALPVKLMAIRLDQGGPVTLEPPVTIRCSLAGALANWIRQDLAPLLATRHGGLVKLSGTGGYECRGRNRVVGAKLSEHATGNAVDIQAFVLADGTAAKITQVAKDDALFAQVKLTTCARFNTVLGPGSDGYHEDNLHLDLETRRGGHFCRWQLP